MQVSTRLLFKPSHTVHRLCSPRTPISRHICSGTVWLTSSSTIRGTMRYTRCHACCDGVFAATTEARRALMRSGRVFLSSLCLLTNSRRGILRVNFVIVVFSPHYFARKGMGPVTALESACLKPSPEIGGILLMWAKGARFVQFCARCCWA